MQVRLRTLDGNLAGHRLVAYGKWAEEFFKQLSAGLSLPVRREESIQCTVEILQQELIGDTLGRTYEM